MNEFVDSTAMDSAMETNEVAVVKNKDNNSLLPWGNEKFVVGSVDEVNGRGGEEIKDYDPTRNELLQLVKYWYEEFLSLKWSFFETSGTGSFELRREHFAKRRINRIATAIGNEAVNQAIEEVHAKCKARVNDDRLWEIFENGDAKQWEAVQDEWMAQQADSIATDDLERLERLERKYPGDFIALVLCDDPRDNSSIVLISPWASELNAGLPGNRQFEVVTDRSGLGARRRRPQLQHVGYLRAIRRDGKLLFLVPDCSPSTTAWNLIGWVAHEINELLHANAEKESQLA